MFKLGHTAMLWTTLLMLRVPNITGRKLTAGAEADNTTDTMKQLEGRALYTTTTCTHVVFTNTWLTDVKFVLLGLDDTAWDGDSRPDKNLNGKIIPANSYIMEREEIKDAEDPGFLFSIVPAATEQEWFQAKVGAYWRDDGVQPTVDFFTFGAPQLNETQFPMTWVKGEEGQRLGFKVFSRQGQELFKFEWKEC